MSWATALPLADGLVPWLLPLMAGAGVGVQAQSGQHKVGVLGTLATVALVLTLVQGPGSPDSLAPAVDGLAGILGPLVLMLIATLLLGPSLAAKPGRHAEAR